MIMTIQITPEQMAGKWTSVSQAYEQCKSEFESGYDKYTEVNNKITGLTQKIRERKDLYAANTDPKAYAAEELKIEENGFIKKCEELKSFHPQVDLLYRIMQQGAKYLSKDSTTFTPEVKSYLQKLMTENECKSYIAKHEKNIESLKDVQTKAKQVFSLYTQMQENIGNMDNHLGHYHKLNANGGMQVNVFSRGWGAVFGVSVPKAEATVLKTEKIEIVETKKEPVEVVANKNS